MKILKCYNNNIVLSKNDKGEQVILIGKGIAFGLRRGDEVDQAKIEKVFELRLEEKEQNRYEELIRSISSDYVTISEEVVSYIKENCSKKINDSILVTLTDHIANTIERLKEGFKFDSAMILNTKTLYSEEHRLAMHVLEMLRERFKDVEIDDPEANFITLHIVMAEMHSNMERMITIAKMTEEILKIIRKYFRIDEKNNYEFDRFMIHCRFFVQRVIDKKQNETRSFNALLSAKLMNGEDDQRRCVEEIAATIYETYNYRVNNDEKLYLLIYLYRLTK